MGLLVAGIGHLPRRGAARASCTGSCWSGCTPDRRGPRWTRVIATYVLIPAFGGRSGLLLGVHGPRQQRPAGRRAPDHPPGQFAAAARSRRGSSWTPMLWLFGAFCFLPLRSPIALAAIPLLLERMLANLFPNWWVTSFQYNAYLVIILACAAVDGAARLDRSLLFRRTSPAGARAGRRDGTADAATATADGARRLAGAGPPEPPRRTARTPPGPEPRAARGTPGRWRWAAPSRCAPSRCSSSRGSPSGPPCTRRSTSGRAQMNVAAAAAAAVVRAASPSQAVNIVGPQLSARDTVLLWDGDGEHPAAGVAVGGRQHPRRGSSRSAACASRSSASRCSSAAATRSSSSATGTSCCIGAGRRESPPAFRLR